LASPPSLSPSERGSPDISRVFRLTVEQVPHPLLVFDGDGRIVAANRMAEVIFGCAPTQLSGQSIAHLLPEAWQALPPGGSRPADTQNRILGVEQAVVGIRTGGGAVPLEIGLKVLLDGATTYTVASVTDVTERLTLKARLTNASTAVGLQSLLIDLADRFLRVAPDEVDAVVDSGIRNVAETLQLDLGILWPADVTHATTGGTCCWFSNRRPSLRDVSQLRALPFISSKLERGEVVTFSQLDEIGNPADREALERQGIRSMVVVPVPASGGSPGALGSLAFGSMSDGHQWTVAVVDQLRLVAGVFGQALARSASLRALQAAHDELRELRHGRARAVDHHEEAPGMADLRSALQAENLCLRREAQERLSSALIVGQSPAIRRVLAQAQQVAATDSTVLLLGETGTGKELIASQIHELSARRGRAMVRVNCSAIPNTLIESELFGREKGAFTGALARQIGRFELADNSTIFLDEIGDLPADVQVKLLRVLEERQVERLGSPKPVHVNVRIVAATHRNLEKRIAEDAFREDLFYRLNVFPIVVPPLRERAEDIPLLVWRFVDEFSKSFGKRIDGISRENMTALQQYSWPGNIRELRNVVERAMIVATGAQLNIVLPISSANPGRRSTKMADVERDHIRSILESSRWRIRGAGGAAERLGLRPTTLETRMIKLGIARPKPS
jgi:PAS domain S-box-containing protein